jgi:hypothetical protein
VDYNAKQMQKALGVVWLILGVILLLSGNSGGVLFVILGLVYLWRMTEQGEAWARQHPQTAQWVLTGLTVFAALVVGVTLFLVDR